MKQYKKTTDGKVAIKTSNQIVIHKDGMKTYNPTEEMILADGWVEYVAPQPSERYLLKKARSSKMQDIQAYDSSNEVNAFFIHGQEVWLDKATRAGLSLRFQAEQALGKETTTLWYGSTMYELPLYVAMQMLLAIEVYASECYDNTQRHLAEVEKLTTIEEIESYDYKVGYPEKLEF